MADQYSYVEVQGRKGRYPAYADVVRVVQGDKRLAPRGYRVVVENPEDCEEGEPGACGPGGGMCEVVIKLVAEMREMDKFVREAVGCLQECGKQMNCRVEALEKNLARVADGVNAAGGEIEKVEEEIKKVEEEARDTEKDVEKVKEKVKKAKNKPAVPQQYGQIPQQPAVPQQYGQVPQQYGQVPQQYGQVPQQYGQVPQQPAVPQQYYETPQQYYETPQPQYTPSAPPQKQPDYIYPPPQKQPDYIYPPPQETPEQRQRRAEYAPVWSESY